VSENREIRHGVLLDESVEMSLGEVCRACEVQAEVIIQLVAMGVVEPHGREPGQWRFAGQAIGRIERALNLQRDLDINLPGVALALELLDEVEALRERLHALEHDLPGVHTQRGGE